MQDSFVTVPTQHEYHVREQARRWAERNPAPAAAAISEKEFQTDVVEFAELHGWNVFYVANSQGSPAGWPDLSMARAGQFVSAELKTLTGRVRPAQVKWGADLDAVDGIEYRLWRPDCWPEIRALLGPPPGYSRQGFMLVVEGAE